MTVQATRGPEASNTETFAAANKKQVFGKAPEATGPKMHTLSARLLVPPAEVMVRKPRPAPQHPVGTAIAPQSVDASKTMAPQLNPPIESVVRLPTPTPLDYTFEVRQQWEGIVTNVNDTEFSVVLRDIVHAGAAEYDAVLSKEEIAADDLPLLKEGAVLYWTIGYKLMRTGQLERVSAIRLRRLPAWSKADIDRVRAEALELNDLFSPE